MRIICDKISLIWSSISWPFFCLRQVILKWQIILQWRMLFMEIYKKHSISRICIKQEPVKRLRLHIMKINFYYSRGYWFHCSPKFQRLHFLHMDFIVSVLQEPLFLVPWITQNTGGSDYIRNSSWSRVRTG